MILCLFGILFGNLWDLHILTTNMFQCPAKIESETVADALRRSRVAGEMLPFTTMGKFSSRVRGGAEGMQWKLGVTQFKLMLEPYLFKTNSGPPSLPNTHHWIGQLTHAELNCPSFCNSRAYFQP